MTRYPIYIPSKGRATTASTPRLLGDLPYTLVVEPTDLGAYRESFPGADILALDTCDRGAQYARQAALAHARGLGVGALWQLDDDLTGLYRVAAGKCTRCPAAEALAYAETLMDALPRVGIVGFAVRQFAWSASKAYEWNRYPVMCILASTSTGIDYDPDIYLAEDLAFWLAHVEAFWRSIKVNAYAVAARPMASAHEGGYQKMYSTENATRYGKMVARRYARFVEFKPLRPGECIGWSRVRYDAVDAHLARLGSTSARLEREGA